MKIRKVRVIDIMRLLSFTAAALLLLSCEMLKPDEEEEFDDGYFTSKLPPRKVVREDIPAETVRVIEAPPVVHADTDDFASLKEVKERAKARELPPFYEKYLEEKDDKVPINLDLIAESIPNILPAFAKVLGFNYAIDPAVKGAVTLNVNNPATGGDLMMSKREVWKLFEHILWMGGAYCSPEGQVLNIMPFQKMSRERKIFAEHQNASNVEVRIFPIRNLASRDILDKLADFLTEGAKATDITGENAILVVETPENIDKIETLINLLDNKQKAIWPRIVIRCSNVSSNRIVHELAAILPVLGFPVTLDKVVAEPGSIHLTSVDRIQAIIASAANKEALDEIIRWVNVLDRSDIGEQEQVFIYKVINSKSDELVHALASIFMIDGVSMSHSGGTAVGGTGGAASAGGTATTTAVTSTQGKAAGQQEGPANIFEVQVKVFADGKNNRLIFRTTPRTYAMIKALLARLDTVPAQVLLQVMIAEVRLNENTEFGVEFSGVTAPGSWSGTFGTNYAGLIPQNVSDNSERGFKYLIANGEDKYAYIRGLAGTGNFKVLASPQIAAVSGTLASLDVGQEIPIVTRTISDTNSGGSALATSNEVEYKKTGVILKITPQVTKGGLITLDIDQVVSARGEDVPAGGQSYPSFINRQLITSLSMRDGSTLLVGGIIQEIDRSQNDSLPLISKVPIIAAALGYNTFQVERTELLIMITASVINEESELEKMINRYKQSIKMIKDFNKSIRSKDEKGDTGEQT